MSKELESKIQRRCQQILKDNKSFVFKTHGSIYQRIGLPDLVACIPTNSTTLQRLLAEDWFKDKQIGIFVGFEVKRENQLNDLSEAQKIVGREIKEAGGLWFAIDDSDYVEAITKMMRGEL